MVCSQSVHSWLETCSRGYQQKMKSKHTEYYLNTPGHGWERCDSEEHARRLMDGEKCGEVIRRTITHLEDPVIQDEVIASK